MSHSIAKTLMKTGLLGLAASIAHAESLLPPESSARCNGAGQVAMQYGQHTVGCAIARAGQIDDIYFHGQVGEEILVIVETSSRNFHPQVQLVSPSGEMVAHKYCEPTARGCMATVHMASSVGGDGKPLAENGKYRLSVAALGRYEEGSFCAQLEKLAPLDNELRISVPFDRTVRGEIDPPTDVDLMVIHGAVGNEILVDVRSVTANFDASLSIWDPNGVLVVSESCDAADSGCLVRTKMRLDQTGAYLVAVSDAGHDESGSYGVSFVCIAGNCPSDLDQDRVPDHTDNCLRVANPAQRDADADGIGNFCDPDLNADCQVNYIDLGLMRAAFYSGDSVADLNGDRSVNFEDLALMRKGYFDVPGPAALPNICRN